MKEALGALAVRQQLSVLSWLHKPAASLLLLLQNAAAFEALRTFMLADESLHHAMTRLGLIL